MASGRTRTVALLYGKAPMALRVPGSAVALAGRGAAALPRPVEAVAAALARPIGRPPLAELLAARRPRSAAVTISDITRPVPNRLLLPPILDALNAGGVPDGRIVVVIGTGMHRPSTPEERRVLIGPEVAARVEVIDHVAADPASLVAVSDDPPVRASRRFAQADFRVVTGYIEPHFMAGFSGGCKGVCPALVDLETIQRFHGYATLADPRAEAGILEGNPCQQIARAVAARVGVDFLVNVSLTHDRRLAGVYCGDLTAAHQAGCRDVAAAVSADVDHPFDLVVTNGGGYPLDATFYQAVKGMCMAGPALAEGSTLLVVAACSEGMGSPGYAGLMARWGDDWRGFLDHIRARPDRTELDQWEFQMQGRVLARVGPENLWFVSDGIDGETQRHIAVRPILGPGDARARAQRAIDDYLAARPDARLAVIPDGPYTMLRRR